ncbi:MAG: response regulator [Actinomycetota bacterium]
MSVRVFILDDHELIRRALGDLLDLETDLELCGEAATVREGLALMSADPPDVAIVDLRLPDGDGIDVCRELRSLNPDTRCLVLTSSTDDDAVMSALLAGASGFLLKDARGPQILDAIRQVAAGRSLLDASVTGRVLDGLRGGEPARSSLTKQEERMLDLLAEGLTNREMAERMHLAEKTVRNYMSNLLAKLGAKHRTQAALFAVRRRRRSQ